MGIGEIDGRHQPVKGWVLGVGGWCLRAVTVRGTWYRGVLLRGCCMLVYKQSNITRNAMGDVLNPSLGRGGECVSQSGRSFGGKRIGMSERE